MLTRQSMVVYSIALLLLTISGGALKAAPDIIHIIRAFDAICVSTKLDRKDIETTAALFSKHTQSKLIQMPEKLLNLTSSDAKSGWGISNGTTPFIVIYGEKTTNDIKSSSCGVSFENIAPDSVIYNIESRYSVKKLIDKTQGVTRIIMYKADLIQYIGKKILISIQASDVENMSIISIFDVR